MNLFELFVKIGVDDQASGKLKDLGGKLGNGLKTAAKIGTAAVGAAAAGITALTTAAVNNYAEYEQLVGGVKTLFKESADTVQQYAENAYKTAGLSANEYMSTVTSFSASLLQSLGGDTEAAAKYADTAVTDMADNANKMGTSIDMLQNAYSGFAKQNFTMLDNLKLGYGGTKEEMQRLLDHAETLPGALGRDFDISNYADIVEAIHLVQNEMGIAGATALEAGTTIEGSVNSMKSAWSNLITGLVGGNADIGQLVDDLVTTIVGDGTESNLGVLGNILPAVQTALTGASTLVSELIPQIVQIIPSIITDNLPILAEAAISIIQSLVDGISQNQEMLMATVVETITFFATSLLSMLPQIVELGLDLIVSLANGISESLPELVPTIVDVVLQILNVIIENAPQMIEAAAALIDSLVLGIENCFTKLSVKGKEIVNSVKEGFSKKVEDAKKWGKDLIQNFIDGITAKWQALKDKVSNVAQTVKDFLGFSEPKKGPLSNFHTYAPDMMDLFIKGIKDNEKKLTDQIEKTFNFGTKTIDFASSGLAQNNNRITSAVSSVLSTANDNATIIVQAVLDGKIIGETVTRYQRRIERAFS